MVARNGDGFRFDSVCHAVIVPAMTYTVTPEIKALLFDFDGTIVDSMPAHCHSWVDAFSAFGAAVSERFIYDHAGVSLIGVVKIYNQQNGTDLSPSEVVTEKDRRLIAHLDEIRIIPEVMRIIERYHGVLPMAVVTGNSRNLTEPLMKRLNLTRYFETVIFGDEVENGKPHPEGFLKAAMTIGAAPHQCEVFEDGDLGLEAGRRAGMKVTDIRPWLEGSFL